MLSIIIAEALQSKSNHQAVEKELSQSAKKVEKDSEVCVCIYYLLFIASHNSFFLGRLSF